LRDLVGLIDSLERGEQRTLSGFVGSHERGELAADETAGIDKPPAPCTWILLSLTGHRLIAVVGIVPWPRQGGLAPTFDGFISHRCVSRSQTRRLRETGDT